MKPKTKPKSGNPAMSKFFRRRKFCKFTAEGIA
jgi:ribosomal protein S18